MVSYEGLEDPRALVSEGFVGAQDPEPRVEQSARSPMQDPVVARVPLAPASHATSTAGPGCFRTLVARSSPRAGAAELRAAWIVAPSPRPPVEIRRSGSRMAMGSAAWF